MLFICGWILMEHASWILSFSHLSLHPPLPSLQQVALSTSSGVGGMVRPVTGADVGIRRAEIRPGLREIILCKDQDGKVGLRLRSIDNVSEPCKNRHLFLCKLFSLGSLSVTLLSDDHWGKQHPLYQPEIRTQMWVRVCFLHCGREPPLLLISVWLKRNITGNKRDTQALKPFRLPEQTVKY